MEASRPAFSVHSRAPSTARQRLRQQLPTDPRPHELETLTQNPTNVQFLNTNKPDSSSAYGSSVASPLCFPACARASSEYDQRASPPRV
ncbi:hypothetical protein E4U42_003435 [Claviceps africana]|uniref:Uncharacterized protein n=1 Tax=Claviceps africana TaxID=83212 RepID=A0A8K0J6L9_9HYPO|nr:hypothetical protein E4U42_003435 [Claviceps africana]